MKFPKLEYHSAPFCCVAKHLNMKQKVVIVHMQDPLWQDFFFFFGGPEYWFNYHNLGYIGFLKFLYSTCDFNFFKWNPRIHRMV